VDQIVALGVFLDVGGDERALGHHLDAGLAGMVHAGLGEQAADAAAREGARHLGVGEAHAFWSHGILAERQVVVHLGLEAALALVVTHLHVGGWLVHRFLLLRFPVAS
jgi:hypothetical protein